MSWKFDDLLRQKVVKMSIENNNIFLSFLYHVVLVLCTRNNKLEKLPVIK